jgi:ribulose-phosphate 3-epimerase
VIQNLSRLTQHKLDAHLMVTNPEFYAEAFKGLGLYNFTFHWEAALQQDRLISALKAIYPSVGISLNPATPLHLVPDYIWHKVDLVLLMSVNPGFGGQHFIPEVLQKVKDLSHIKHKLGCHFQIQVDGGINQDNASLLKNAGAHNLVAGSFIFSEPHHDYINRINQLR